MSYHDVYIPLYNTYLHDKKNTNTNTSININIIINENNDLTLKLDISTVSVYDQLLLTHPIIVFQQTEGMFNSSKDS